jgi:hypothetical protein
VRARSQYRHHTKATLVRAAAGLMLQNGAQEAIARRRWLRRVVLAAVVAFTCGIMLGVMAMKG